MKIKIVKSDDYRWYKNLIDTEFIVQSESRKGGKGKYVIRIPKELRYLMNICMVGLNKESDMKERIGDYLI